MLSIVVIGAGFTGTMTAVHLAQRARTPLRVTLIERSGRFARGVAYGTRQECHLLNVPAGRMSAFPDDEGHFLRWAYGRDSTVRGGSFLPRAIYGTYLRDTLAAARAAAAPRARIVPLAAEAGSISGSGDRLRVECSDGQALDADAVVLAVGNYPPADPPCASPDFYASGPYRRDPWSPDALDVDPDAEVLLLGTSLTMIDVAMSLREHGHRGTIHAVSRRGLLPQSHRESMVASSDLPPPRGFGHWPATAFGLLRAVRGEVERGGRGGVDWRDVMTSLRSITPALWTSLPQRERRRFLRHLRPFWETHRHRIAPAIGAAVRRMRDEGTLNVLAARVLRYETRGATACATVRLRGSGKERTLSVARVINCTGPDTDLSRARDPLMRSLRESGTIRPDALGLGLDSDEDGHVIDARGRAHPRLFLAGPLRRGLLWENVAVPELRVEAQRLARLILDRFEPGRPPLGAGVDAGYPTQISGR